MVYRGSRRPTSALLFGLKIRCRCPRNFVLMGFVCFPGERTETTPHLLQEVQGPQAAQGDAVQEVQGAQGSSGQASLRQETAGFRRSDQAHLQEEGKCPHSSNATGIACCRIAIDTKGGKIGIPGMALRRTKSLRSLSIMLFGGKKTVPDQNCCCTGAAVQATLCGIHAHNAPLATSDNPN